MFLQTHLKKALLLCSLLLSTNLTAAPVVVIDTSQGRIEITLNEKKAPATVANFLRYLKEGFYKDTVFHRVIDGFMIQAGGYDRDYHKKAVHAPIKNEADNGLQNSRGSIAMARTMDPHSATSQFFINLLDNRSLDHTAKNARGWGYAVFGKVSTGMDVVEHIGKVRTGSGPGMLSNVPKTPIIIHSIQVKN